VLLYSHDGEGGAGGGELLPPSGGWKQAGATASLEFRAMIVTSGDVELSVVL